MRPSRTARQTHLYIAGAGLAFALVAALAGWHIAAPAGGGTALVTPVASPAPHHSSSRPVAASWQKSATPPPSAVSPAAIATSSAASPQPAAPSPPAPDPQAAAHKFFVQARTSTPPPSEPLDPYLPGHSITAAGQRVYVEGMQYHQPTGQTALSVAVVPDPKTPTTATSETSPRLSSSGTGTNVEASMLDRFGRGYTYEEELFRAKWGWETYNATQTTAQQVAATPTKP